MPLSHLQPVLRKFARLQQFPLLLSRNIASLSARDRKLIWHPFTQEETAEPSVPIKSAKGSYVYDENGKPYLDLISSWWVNLHGHANPELAEIIYRQAQTLEHVIFAGFTNEPAVKLCESLTEVLPAKFQRFFFTDDGSTAVEAALKMAYQFWHNKGEGGERTNFLCFEGGYHGDTFGAMSVGHGSGYFNTFTPFLFKTLKVPFPATWDGDGRAEAKEVEALWTLERHLRENEGKVAAMIMEPLVQGVSRMSMCNYGFLERAVEILRQHSVLVIFDESLTGFGRTGSLFALNQLKDTCHPDILCLSKGITGGFLPLALTITTEHIYEEFLGEDFETAFPHGHSYTGNPISCAAAVKSLEILRRPGSLEARKQIQIAQEEGLQTLIEEMGPLIKNPRKTGTIAAFEVEGVYDFNLALHLQKAFVDKGLLLRPIQNNVYLMPPYCTTAKEVRDSYSVIAKVLKAL